MKILFFIILVLLVLILVALLFYIILHNKSRDVEQKRVEIKEEQQSEAPPTQTTTISSLILPHGMEELSREDLDKAGRAIYKFFTAASYDDHDERYLENDWHSWQVGLLLLYYKRGEQFHIAKPREVFRKDILESSKADIKRKMNGILIRYQAEVDVTQDRHNLSEDRRWSGEELATIFYFLLLHKS